MAAYCEGRRKGRIVIGQWSRTSRTNGAGGEAAFLRLVYEKHRDIARSA